MTRRKEFVIQASPLFFKGYFRIPFIVKFDDSAYFHFVFREGSCLVEAHYAQMGSFYCLLWLSPEDAVPLESKERKWVDKVEVDGSGRGKAECDDK